VRLQASQKDVTLLHPDVQHLWSQLQTLELRNDIVYRQYQWPMEQYATIDSCAGNTAKAVLDQVHSSPTAGHMV